MKFCGFWLLEATTIIPDVFIFNVTLYFAWHLIGLLQQYSILVALSHVIWVIVHGDRLLRFKILETSLKPSFLQLDSGVPLGFPAQQGS
ncbi:hypothetical protein AHAS_Ahas17G0260200 [Arachis hypogaea]